MRAKRLMAILWISGTEDGQLELPAVPEFLAALGLHEVPEAEEGPRDDADDPVPVVAHEVAQVHEELGGGGQGFAEVLEDFREDGHDLHDEEDRDEDRDGDDGDRVGHGRLDLFAQARAGFEEAGEAVEDLREQTARLTGLDHGDVEAVEDRGMLLERGVEAVAALHAAGDVADDRAQVGLFLRVGALVEGGQRADERDARVDHGGELAGEEDEVGFLDAGGLACVVLAAPF